ncbi:MAG: fused MFS/spermidine synthase [Candidatus Adiutrix sp.]|jgi:spermidine synthase|nr:fused MFS/spermidine synthase [Candidatus Adiutrix sp.]
MLRVWPFILLFFSGFSALSYQMVWMREFRLVFGASTASTAAVSALFMAGLGLGGWRLGPRADRDERPFFLYGRLELAVSILAALSPLLLALTRHLYLRSGGLMVLGPLGATAARLLLAALVIGLPAFLMGGTLPAAARAVIREQDGARLSLGALYGINTLGALSGALLSTFVLLEAWGARNTLFLAVAVNFLVALIALAQGRGRPEASAAEIPSRSGNRSTDDSEAPAIPLPLALGAAAVLGFAFFLMELVWYRMLAPVLGGSIYTFGLILTTALAGIGLGGALYPVFFRNRRPDAWPLAATCLLEALALMLPFALGDWLPAAAVQLRTLSALGFIGLFISWLLITLLVVFPAAVISGLQFPLLISLLGRGRQGLGRQTGLAYALNTAGAIVGSLAGGFGLMPLLGATGCWLLAGGFLLALALLLAAGAFKNSLRQAYSLRRRLVAGGLLGIFFLAALLCLTASGPSAAWRHSPVGAGRVSSKESLNEVRSWMNNSRAGLLWEADGVESAVGIVDSDGYAVVVNGKIDGNVLGDRGTQIMVGLIGAALHPEPRRSLVIGLGTGCTAGWLSAVPGMDQVDVVELEPSVLNMARLSASANQDIVAKAEAGAGARIIINDAREVLITTPDRYDLIVSEPSNPYRAGVASLFTREFYQEVAGRLAPGGFFLSWCQAYEVDTRTVFTILATLKTVFPYVECWTTQFPSDLMFLASMEPLGPDTEMLKARLAAAPYQEAMRLAWGTEGLEGLLSQYLANDEYAAQVARAIPENKLNTDDLIPVEYAYAHTVGQSTNFSSRDFYLAALERRQYLPNWLPQGIDLDGLVMNQVLSFADDEQSIPGWLMSRLDSRQRERARALENWGGGEYRAVIDAWESQGRPTYRLEKLALAESQAWWGQEEAGPLAATVGDWWPASAAIVKAILDYQLDRYPEALSGLERAFFLMRASPWEPKIILDRSLDLALELAERYPESAGPLYTALSEPFQLALLEKRRKAALLTLSEYISLNKMAETLKRWHEPNPMWNQVILEKRVRAYAATADPLLAAARRDLELYEAAEDARVDDLLE